jgi:hypothetical protein
LKEKTRKNVKMAASLLLRSSSLLYDYNEELSNALLITCSELVGQLDYSPLVDEDEINDLVKEIKDE